MWFLLVPFVLKEPCSRPGDPDIALQSNVPRCLFSPTSNEMPNSQLCPDITGGISLVSGGTEKTSGAFYTSMSYSANHIDSPVLGKTPGIHLSASLASGYFGRSNGVSVDALYALMIIKT